MRNCVSKGRIARRVMAGLLFAVAAGLHGSAQASTIEDPLYESSTSIATPTLTGSADAEVAAPATPAGSVLNPASGTFAFFYDASTGDVKINYNGFAGTAAHPFIPGTSTLSVIDITSANGAAFPLDVNKLTTSITTILPTGAKTPPTHIVLNSAATPPVIADGTDIGTILPPGLDPVALAADLTLKINFTGSSSLNFTAGITAPEPTTLSMLGLGALGLMARRRKIASVA